MRCYGGCLRPQRKTGDPKRKDRSTELSRSRGVFFKKRETGKAASPLLEPERKIQKLCMEVPLPLQLQGLSAEEEQLILALSAQARLQYAVSTPPSDSFLVNVLAQEFQVLEQLLATRRKRRTYDRAGSFDICR